MPHSEIADTANACAALKQIPSRLDSAEAGTKYRTARPFPHLVLDDFLPDRLADACHVNWPARPAPKWKSYRNGKRAWHQVAELPSPLRDVMTSLNQEPFVESLSRLCDVDDLRGDDTFAGAGLHEVQRGGSLGMHVDFNTLGPLFRRVNVLLYLNRNWSPEWNGHLELRANPSSLEGRKVIQPAWNRLVIFEASERSWHGHPTKLECPDDCCRRSMAWYFYSPQPAEGFQKAHSTIYRG